MQTLLPYLKWLESQLDEMTELVTKWARINSCSDNLAGLAEMLSVLVKDFLVLEGKMQVLSLAPRQVISPKGSYIDKPAAQVLSIKKRPDAPFQVLLGGHMDTVFSPTHAFQQVERLDQETLRGPGVTDMKGGLAILLKTLEAFERSPFAQAIGWEVLINPDEEIGSPSSSPLFIEAAKRHQIGLIFEPSFADGAFIHQRKGSATYTLIAKGEAAHAGRDFATGKSAIYALAALIHELEELNAPGQGRILNVGHIEGGGPVNIVPDFAKCRLNVRTNTAEDMHLLKEKIQEIVQVCQQRRGTQLTLIEESLRLPKPLTRSTEQLFDLYQTCAEQLGQPFHLRESGGVTDGNTLAEAGLPTLDSVGAIGGKIHTDEEYLHLPSLVKRAQLNALFLFKLASRTNHE